MPDLTRKTACIQLLGGLSLPTPGGGSARIETRRAASLLAFLAIHRKRRHPREELIEMLWPEEDMEATRIRFRQVLTTLRRTLEAAAPSQKNLLVADRTSVQLNPLEITTDVAEFENALTAAARADSTPERLSALRRAVDQYGGELLPGFYDDWVLAERRRLEEDYLGALNRLTRALVENGEPAAALEYARRAIRHDPLREEAYLDLIQLLAQEGRVADALRQYRDLEQVLWKELRATPGSEMQALIEAIRSGASFAFAALPAKEVSDVSAHREKPQPLPLDTSLPQMPSVPLPLTRFFGRQAEIEHLVSLLAMPAEGGSGTRLLTLVGPGGSGKTRLSLEVARRLQTVRPGCVWFVPLAEVTNPALIVSAIADVLKPAGQPGMDAWDHCLTRLAPQKSLLILDSLEHLVEEGAQTVRALLERAPDLTCLVTSRQRLNLGGEQDYVVQPLPIPAKDENPADLAALPSIQLFLDRAQQVSSHFQLTAANEAALAALCRRLEGIPLALELAAAWAGTLTPAQMLTRLDQRFELLVSRRLDMDQRHRSLRATLEWSFSRLDPALQGFFAHLGIFRGGWSLDAAEAVCAEAQALDGLAQLGQRSLLVTQPQKEEIRFSMLETLREYAWEQLAPEKHLPLCRRHAEWYLNFAERISPALTGPDQILLLDRLELETENFRAALRWYAREGALRQDTDTEAGLCLTGSLWRFWDVRGHHREGQEWLETFLSGAQTSPSAVRARALEAAGSLALALGELEQSRNWFEESLNAAHRLETPHRQASVLCSLGKVLCTQGDLPAAHAAFEESRTLFKAQHDNYGVARTLEGAAQIAFQSGDFRTAQSFYDQSAALYRIAGHLKGMAASIYMNGVAAGREGRIPTAQKRLSESLVFFRQLNDKLGIEQAQLEIEACQAVAAG